MIFALMENKCFKTTYNDSYIEVIVSIRNLLVAFRIRLSDVFLWIQGIHQKRLYLLIWNDVFWECSKNLRNNLSKKTPWIFCLWTKGNGKIIKPKVSNISLSWFYLNLYFLRCQILVSVEMGRLYFLSRRTKIDEKFTQK